MLRSKNCKIRQNVCRIGQNFNRFGVAFVIRYDCLHINIYPLNTQLNSDVKVSTTNEYGKLKSVLLGSVQGGAWPTDDNFFDTMISSSTWPTKLEKSQFDANVIADTDMELNLLLELLEQNDVEVHRPSITGPHWAYIARDILLTVGDKLIECPTPYTSRRDEASLYQHIKEKATCNWIKAPTPQKDSDPTFDAANVLKLDDKLLYLVSKPQTSPELIGCNRQ